MERLKKYYNCDSSNLLKKSLWDLYEEIKDREIIEEFEDKEKVLKTELIGIEDILK